MQNLVNPTTKAGWSKFSNFCILAEKLGFEWVWDDTCCIDKTNSAELSEAINCMYMYYRLATLCIVYLEDVGPMDWHPHCTEGPLLPSGGVAGSREDGLYKNCLLPSMLTSTIETGRGLAPKQTWRVFCQTSLASTKKSS